MTEQTTRLIDKGTLFFENYFMLTTVAKNIEDFFTPHSHLFIQQIKEWVEILTGFETKNRYRILSPSNQELGYMAERGSGLLSVLSRLFLRTHRPMKMSVWHSDKSLLLEFWRPFHWFFSDLTVKDAEGNVLGHIYKRFGFLLFKKYDLCLADGKVFARIDAFILRLWTFNIHDCSERKIGVISKKWGGILKEVFTDADRYLIQFEGLTAQQKAIIFAAALSIDMDYFDDNQRN